MLWPNPIWAGVFGLVVGSFINVVIHRLPLGKSVVRPPSSCPHCQKRLKWYDNIPVVGFMMLRGRCRSCQKKISIRYPIVELIVGILFVLAAFRYGWSPVLVFRDWPFLAALVAVTFIDIDHRIIPDPISIGGTVYGLAWAAFVPELGLAEAALGAGVGFGVFFGFGWVYYKMTGRMGLGGGDVKLLAMFGAFLGLQGVLTTVLLSSIVGSLFGLSWALIKGKKEILKTSMPYGPFLVMGAICYYFLGEALWLRFMIPT